MKPVNREILFNQKILIVVFFLLALIVRLVALKQNYVIAHDGTLYIKMAKLFAAGQYQYEIFSAGAYYAFFPLLIFAFHKVLGDWFLAGQLISLCFGSLTIIPLYLLARRLFDEQIALIGAFLASDVKTKECNLVGNCSGSFLVRYICTINRITLDSEHDIS